jgi:hypothetical protein
MVQFLPHARPFSDAVRRDIQLTPRDIRLRQFSISLHGQTPRNSVSSVSNGGYSCALKSQRNFPARRSGPKPKHSSTAMCGRLILKQSGWLGRYLDIAGNKAVYRVKEDNGIGTVNKRAVKGLPGC